MADQEQLAGHMVGSEPLPFVVERQCRAIAIRSRAQYTRLTCTQRLEDDFEAGEGVDVVLTWHEAHSAAPDCHMRGLTCAVCALPCRTGVTASATGVTRSCESGWSGRGPGASATSAGAGAPHAHPSTGTGIPQLPARPSGGAQQHVIGEMECHGRLVGTVLLQLLLESVGVLMHKRRHLLRRMAMMARQVSQGGVIVFTF